jgi:hypothetical protein
MFPCLAYGGPGVDGGPNGRGVAECVWVAPPGGDRAAGLLVTAPLRQRRAAVACYGSV